VRVSLAAAQWGKNVLLIGPTKMTDAVASVLVIPLTAVAGVEILHFPASGNVLGLVHTRDDRENVGDGVLMSFLQHEDVFLVITHDFLQDELLLTSILAK